MRSSRTRRRVATLRFSVVALVAALALSTAPAAVLAGPDENKPTTKVAVPKSQWPKAFAKKYKKAKKLLRKCQWKPAYKHLIKFRKGLIKYRGWHGARDLAVSAYPWNKKRGKKWARYGIKYGPEGTTHTDGIDLSEIKFGYYVVPIRPMCH